jgi:hypothetical protein
MLFITDHDPLHDQRHHPCHQSSSEALSLPSPLSSLLSLRTSRLEVTRAPCFFGFSITSFSLSESSETESTTALLLTLFFGWSPLSPPFLFFPLSDRIFRGTGGLTSPFSISTLRCSSSFWNSASFRLRKVILSVFQRRRSHSRTGSEVATSLRLPRGISNGHPSIITWYLLTISLQ